MPGPPPVSATTRSKVLIANCRSTTITAMKIGAIAGRMILAVDARHAGAVDLRRLDQVLVDRAEAGEKQRHGEARGLPDAGDDHRVDRVVACWSIQSNLKSVQPEAADHELDARGRAVEPAPDRAGDDEGDRQRIEVDRPPDRLAAHALVDQDGEQQPDRRSRRRHRATLKRKRLRVGDRSSAGCATARRSARGRRSRRSAAACELDSEM